MTLDEAIERYTSNAEYERTHGSLQGCLDFKQLAEWLRDYKRLKEQEPCEDAISRDAVEEIINDIRSCISVEGYWAILERLKKLPSVKPQERTGHWIDIMVGDMPAQVCDRCNTFYPLAYTGGGHKYCPNCGAKMEVEE